MAKVDPRDFLLNTDYEMDKIVYFKEGSTSSYQQTFDHGLGFTPLIFGVCSENSDYSESHSIPYLYQTQDDYKSFDVRANGSTITIECVNNVPVYYRIFAFEPSDSKSHVGYTSKYASQFILNTDYNYCKLFKKDLVSGTGTFTIPHNLGYIPQVLAWGENSGKTFPIELSEPENPAFGNPTNLAVTDSALIIRNNAGAYTKIHYRIYYDEA